MTNYVLWVQEHTVMCDGHTAVYGSYAEALEAGQSIIRDTGNYWLSVQPDFQEFRFGAYGVIYAYCRMFARNGDSVAVHIAQTRQDPDCFHGVDFATEATTGYLDAQLWAQSDYFGDIEDEMLDANYSTDDIDPDYVEYVRDDIEGLFDAEPWLIFAYLTAGRSAAHFGHDYYLTREGHGTGFWDRGLGLVGDALTETAKSAGTANPLADGRHLDKAGYTFNPGTLYGTEY